VDDVEFQFLSPDTRFSLLTLIALLVVLSSTLVSAQTTVAQGSIQGIVTDPSGAVVSGAKITITHKATGQVVTTSSTSPSTYNSGGLIPGRGMSLRKMWTTPMKNCIFRML
jgi:hypothetical protein